MSKNKAYQSLIGLVSDIRNTDRYNGTYLVYSYGVRRWNRGFMLGLFLGLGSVISVTLIVLLY